MKDITKKYSNGEVTVVWKPSMCIHSRNCFNGLSKVFDPSNKPWVNIEGAGTKEIVDQIKKCPSGALSYLTNNQKEEVEATTSETIIELAQDGPLMVRGDLIITTADGKSLKKNNVTAFCRCGASGNKPFCDGSHKKVGFRG
ncbi:MAG: (4Fe-4S)-binding protein [Cyclobacteriaceae bacterium]